MAGSSAGWVKIRKGAFKGQKVFIGKDVSLAYGGLRVKTWQEGRDNIVKQLEEQGQNANRRLLDGIRATRPRNTARRRESEDALGSGVAERSTQGQQPAGQDRRTASPEPALTNQQRLKRERDVIPANPPPGEWARTTTPGGSRIEVYSPASGGPPLYVVNGGNATPNRDLAVRRLQDAERERIMAASPKVQAQRAAAAAADQSRQDQARRLREAEDARAAAVRAERAERMKARRLEDQARQQGMTDQLERQISRAWERQRAATAAIQQAINALRELGVR